MGKVLSIMSRPIRNFNIENRAHKFISKEKPIRAPQYESTLRQIKVADEVDPGFMEKQKTKDSKLDKYLKDIYVTSKDQSPDLSNKADPTKFLPTSRKTFEYEDFNFYYVNNPPEGKCSMQQLQSFLSNYMDDPKKYNASHIAKEYRLDKKVVENILEHYKLFKIIHSAEIEKLIKGDSSKAIEDGGVFANLNSNLKNLFPKNCNRNVSLSKN